MIIQDMYNDCETLVSTRTGDTEYFLKFHVGVGLHQGSALSPLLFILIMDVLQAEIGKEPPWVMLFADDLVICEHSRAEVEIQLERWRETFEYHGLRVSRGKTEYMPCPERDQTIYIQEKEVKTVKTFKYLPCPERDQTIYIQEKEVKTVKTFKYLGSMFDANGGAEKDVNNRVKIAWSKWRETTGVMCDRNIPTKLKDKMYKTAIKPAMVYGAECWAVRKKEERKFHTTEMRMLRWARGKTRLDHVRNVDIWNEAHMYPMAEFLREKRLR